MNLLIKVCGMTQAENIRKIEQLSVDVIGFIFYPHSPVSYAKCPNICPYMPNAPVFLSTKPKKIS